MCVLILFLFPLVSALWMAVICLWLVDAGNNTAMEPYRALISDRLRKIQIPRGFLTQSLFTGAGAVLANVSLFVMQKFITGATESNVPYWVFVCFWLGAVCCLVTIGIAMTRTKEIPPTDAELAEIRSQSKGIPATVKDIAEAVKVMPIGMHKIGLAFLFQWYAMFIYWQFVSVSVGESVFNAAPETPGYEEAAAWTGLMNGTYNFVTMISALFLLPLCLRFGGKRVHAGTLMLAAVSLAALSQISSQILTLVPMIGLGICWASMVGVPYLMVASMVPRERTGVYMGILNMMIVVPMLIQTLTFGFIFENFLDSKGTSAILLAGVLLGCAGLAMLWVNPPKSDEESTVMPLGGHREITVYDRVDGRLRRLAVRAVRRRQGPGDRGGRPGPHRRGLRLRTRRRNGGSRRGRRPQAHVRRAGGARRHAQVSGRADLGPHPRHRAGGGRRETGRGTAEGGRPESGHPHRGGQPRSRGHRGRGAGLGAARDRADRRLRRDDHPDLGCRRKRRVPAPRAPRLVLGGRSTLTVSPVTGRRLLTTGPGP